MVDAAPTRPLCKKDNPLVTPPPPRTSEDEPLPVPLIVLLAVVLNPGDDPTPVLDEPGLGSEPAVSVELSPAR